jgi:hypothetical protein
VKGTWREGLLQTLEGGSPIRDFERWMKGVLGMEHLSLKTQCRELLGRAPLLGTLDMLRKALNTSIYLHRGPSMSEGNLESGWELVYQEH